MTVILNIHFSVAQLNPGLSVRLQRDTATGVVVKLEEKWSCRHTQLPALNNQGKKVVHVLWCSEKGQRRVGT